MKLYTKNSFENLFKVGVIILLFTYQPIKFIDKREEDVNKKSVLDNNTAIQSNFLPFPQLNQVGIIKPVAIFKTKFLNNKVNSIKEEDSIRNSGNEDIAELFEISFPQLGFK